MMYRDILTVMWKAQKGLFRIQGRKGQTLLMMFTPLMLAVVMPLQLREAWVESGLSLMIAVIIPLLLVGTSIPAAFASEREQHTLPTLLASRLSNQAILFGKMITSVAFGWGVTLVVLLLGLVTANIALWDGHLIFYKPTIFLADLVISLLIALLLAGAGVLFSLRAESVQQAQQSLMAVMLIPLMLLQAAFFILGTSSSGKTQLKAILESVSFEQFSLILAAFLALLAVGVIIIAIRQFKRARLILS